VSNFGGSELDLILSFCVPLMLFLVWRPVDEEAEVSD
jgi:hypothetical protein